MTKVGVFLAKIVAIVNQKGGVGKTTVALQIAVARAMQGKDVWYVDGDRQQTGLMALTLRESQKVKAQISCASYRMERCSVVRSCCRPISGTRS